MKLLIFLDFSTVVHYSTLRKSVRIQSDVWSADNEVKKRQRYHPMSQTISNWYLNYLPGTVNDWLTKKRYQKLI